MFRKIYTFTYTHKKIVLKISIACQAPLFFVVVKICIFVALNFNLKFKRETNC